MTEVTAIAAHGPRCKRRSQLETPGIGTHDPGRHSDQGLRLRPNSRVTISRIRGCASCAPDGVELLGE
jgi:hypothetical protein